MWGGTRGRGGFAKTRSQPETESTMIEGLTVRGVGYEYKKRLAGDFKKSLLCWKGYGWVTFNFVFTLPDVRLGAGGGSQGAGLSKKIFGNA